MEQGEIWWASLPEPAGSEPGYRRPVVIVQGDAFNRSRIRTIVCVAVTSNLALADAPGNSPFARSTLTFTSDALVRYAERLDQRLLSLEYADR